MFEYEEYVRITQKKSLKFRRKKSRLQDK